MTKYKKGYPKYKEGQCYKHEKDNFVIKLGKRHGEKFEFEVIVGENPNMHKYSTILVDKDYVTNPPTRLTTLTFPSRVRAVSTTSLYRLYTRDSTSEALYGTK